MKIKIISVFVLLLLLISCLSFSVFADSCPHTNTEEMYGDPDSNCNVTVSIYCLDCGDSTTLRTENCCTFSDGVCVVCGSSDPDYSVDCSHPDYYEHKTESDDSCVLNVYYLCSVCNEVLEYMTEESHFFLNGSCTNCGAEDPDYVEQDCPHESTYESGGDADSFCNVTVAIMCSDCGALVGSYTDTYHDYSDGYCTRCGALDLDHIDPETCTHSWDFGTTVSPSTCAKAGQIMHTCALCGETKYVAKEKIPHSYGPYTYVCAQNQRKAVCLICGYENVEYLYGGTIHQYQNGVCIYCGQKNNTGTTPGADVHIWDKGAVTLEPTCTSNGIKMYTCTLCWQTKGEVIRATGHKYVNGTCSVCGTKETGGNHVHDFRWASKKDEKQHIVKCAECGIEKLMDHTDSNSDGVCDVCKVAFDSSVGSVDTDKNPSGFDDVGTEKNIGFKRVLGAVFGVVLICVIFYFVAVVFLNNSKERNRKRK